MSDLVATHFYKLVERINAVANLCLIMDESGIPKKRRSIGRCYQTILWCYGQDR